MKSLLAAAALLGASSAAAAPLVVAHRGATGYLPENSLAAFELAIAQGADFVEFDLFLSADGVPVVMHDLSLVRTTNAEDVLPQRNGGWNVTDYTLAELETLIVEPTGTASTVFPGFTPSTPQPFKVPTLQEVIDLVQAAPRPVGLYPEMKQFTPELEAATLQTLKANGLADADDLVFLQTFSFVSLSRVAALQATLGTDVDLVMLGAAARGPFGPGGSLLDLLAVLDAGPFAFPNSNDGAVPLPFLAGPFDGLNVSIDDLSALNSALIPLDAAFIAAAQAAGLFVHGYTFREPDPTLAAAQFAPFVAAGIDGLVADYPDLARAAATPVAPVPLPGAALMLGSALLALRLVRRR